MNNPYPNKAAYDHAQTLDGCSSHKDKIRDAMYDGHVKGQDHMAAMIVGDLRAEADRKERLGIVNTAETLRRCADDIERGDDADD